MSTMINLSEGYMTLEYASKTGVIRVTLDDPDQRPYELLMDESEFEALINLVEAAKTAMIGPEPAPATKTVNTMTNEEVLIVEAIVAARDVQDFIWQELSYQHHGEFNIDLWVPILQKRIDKIKLVDVSLPHHRIEVRKRLLQLAALSIMSLAMLDDGVPITANDIIQK